VVYLPQDLKRSFIVLIHIVGVVALFPLEFFQHDAEQGHQEFTSRWSDGICGCLALLLVLETARVRPDL
jgi:hypothetical protein